MLDEIDDLDPLPLEEEDAPKFCDEDGEEADDNGRCPVCGRLV